FEGVLRPSGSVVAFVLPACAAGCSACVSAACAPSGRTKLKYRAMSKVVRQKRNIVTLEALLATSLAGNGSLSTAAPASNSSFYRTDTSARREERPTHPRLGR